MSVYFVQCGKDGPIKIGYTDDLLVRMKTLQACNPEKLVLRALLVGGESEEYELQVRFIEHHIHREWFLPSAEVLEFIDRQPAMPREAVEWNAQPLCLDDSLTDGGRPRKVREMSEKDAETHWLNTVKYKTDKDALEHMPGWTLSAAWRLFGRSGRKRRGRPPKKK